MNGSRKDAKNSVAGGKESRSSSLPSSPGDTSQAVTPKDVSPKDASWADVHERNIASHNKQEHEEALLDEAVDESFPASDPVAEMPATHGSQQYGAGSDEEEDSLDQAIEMTFPASDPIAIPSSEEMSHEKDLRQHPPHPSGSPSR